MAHDFKPTSEGPRDDLFGAMPPLEAKKALFACVAKVHEKGREQDQEEVKLKFIDVTKAHHNAKCDDEEWVELLTEFDEFGRYAKMKRWLHGMRKVVCGWEGDHVEKVVNDGFLRGRAASTIFSHPKTRVPVVVQCDVFNFNSTEMELKKIRSKMPSGMTSRCVAPWAAENVMFARRRCWKEA